MLLDRLNDDTHWTVKNIWSTSLPSNPFNITNLSEKNKKKMKSTTVCSRNGGLRGGQKGEERVVVGLKFIKRSCFVFGKQTRLEKWIHTHTHMNTHIHIHTHTHTHRRPSMLHKNSALTELGWFETSRPIKCWKRCVLGKIGVSDVESNLLLVLLTLVMNCAP